MKTKGYGMMDYCINLARLYSPTIQSNNDPGIAVKVFCS